jgi:hypothetical protein
MRMEIAEQKEGDVRRSGRPFADANHLDSVFSSARSTYSA